MRCEVECSDRFKVIAAFAIRFHEASIECSKLEAHWRVDRTDLCVLRGLLAASTWRAARFRMLMPGRAEFVIQS